MLKEAINNNFQHCFFDIKAMELLSFFLFISMKFFGFEGD